MEKNTLRKKQPWLSFYFFRFFTNTPTAAIPTAMPTPTSMKAIGMSPPVGFVGGCTGGSFGGWIGGWSGGVVGGSLVGCVIGSFCVVSGLVVGVTGGGFWGLLGEVWLFVVCVFSFLVPPSISIYPRYALVSIESYDITVFLINIVFKAEHQYNTSIHTPNQHNNTNTRYPIRNHSDSKPGLFGDH